MEFFKNIWQWIVDNKEAILTFVTSTQFLLFIKCILDMRKNKLDGIANNKFLADLGTAFDTGVKRIEDIDVVSELNAQREALNNIAMAMMIAYSTVKDDNIRTEVTAYLNKAMNPKLLAAVKNEDKTEDVTEDVTEDIVAEEKVPVEDEKATKANVTASRC